MLYAKNPLTLAFHLCSDFILETLIIGKSMFRRRSLISQFDKNISVMLYWWLQENNFTDAFYNFKNRILILKLLIREPWRVFLELFSPLFRPLVYILITYAAYRLYASKSAADMCCCVTLVLLLRLYTLKRYLYRQSLILVIPLRFKRRHYFFGY